MTGKEKHTEEKIAEAAREVFIEKGMSGARMQEIADRAGINKSLLHYYFRSKEKLFNFIFTKIINRLGSIFNDFQDTNKSIEEKMTLFVETYIDILVKNPFLPNFIFNEATRNPDIIFARMKEANIDPEKILSPIQNQLKKEGYNIPITDFMLNLISLVIFPIAAKPIVSRLLFKGDQVAYKAYLETRKTNIVKFYMSALEGYRN